MRQKVLNKMGKYCKEKGLPFVELVIQLAEHDASDSGITLAFNKLWQKDKPKRDRGGYYPHGHKKGLLHEKMRHVKARKGTPPKSF